MLINRSDLLESIKKRLSINYQENTDDVIVDIIEDMISEALDISNMRKEDERLIPYIKEAVIAEYLARGAEGFTSRNEGSISSSFYDITERLRKNIVKNGLRRLP